MNTIDIKKTARPDGTETFRLVHRSHDMADTQYMPLMEINSTVASALGRNGVVVRGETVLSHLGQPGLVFLRDGDRHMLELRADVADPTTTMHVIEVDPWLPSMILSDGLDQYRIQWVHGEPVSG